MGQDIKDKKVYLRPLEEEHLEKTFSWVQSVEFRESFKILFIPFIRKNNFCK